MLKGEDRSLSLRLVRRRLLFVTRSVHQERLGGGVVLRGRGQRVGRLLRAVAGGRRGGAGVGRGGGVSRRRVES